MQSLIGVFDHPSSSKVHSLPDIAVSSRQAFAYFDLPLNLVGSLLRLPKLRLCQSNPSRRPVAFVHLKAVFGGRQVFYLAQRRDSVRLERANRVFVYLYW